MGHGRAAGPEVGQEVMPQLAVHGLIAGWACMVSQACPQPSTSTAPPPDTTPHFPRSLQQLTRGNGQDEMRAAPPWCLPSCCTHANLDPSPPTKSSPVAVAAAHTHTQPPSLPLNQLTRGNGQDEVGVAPRHAVRHLAAQHFHVAANGRPDGNVITGGAGPAVKEDIGASFYANTQFGLEGVQVSALQPMAARMGGS